MRSVFRKMPLDLYYIPGSPPCRAVFLAAKAIGVELNLKFVNLSEGEHLKPEFLKLNPQHTVPTLDDNGLHIIESRAIMTYLVDQYSKNDALYPKDPKKRALIDQRMYFDIGTLYQRFSDYYYVPIFAKIDYDPAKMTKIQEAFKFLDAFLEKSEYVAGDSLSLADLAVLVSVNTYQACDFDVSSYKNVTKWLAKLSNIPGIEDEQKQNKDFKTWYNSTKNEAKKN